jgi:uroporphyrinogen decarboxylase
LSPDVLSVDWKTPLIALEADIPPGMALQGNVDPTLLFSSIQDIAAHTKKSYSDLSRRSRIIANLGHGLLPATPLEGLQSYLSAVHDAWN